MSTRPLTGSRGVSPRSTLPILSNVLLETTDCGGVGGQGTCAAATASLQRGGSDRDDGLIQMNPAKTAVSCGVTEWEDAAI